jgi:hypothetical protein
MADRSYIVPGMGIYTDPGPNTRTVITPGYGIVAQTTSAAAPSAFVRIVGERQSLAGDGGGLAG